jgi:hypothetical protein
MEPHAWSRALADLIRTFEQAGEQASYAVLEIISPSARRLLLAALPL